MKLSRLSHKNVIYLKCQKCNIKEAGRKIGLFVCLCDVAQRQSSGLISHVTMVRSHPSQFRGAAIRGTLLFLIYDLWTACTAVRARGIGFFHYFRAIPYFLFKHLMYNDEKGKGAIAYENEKHEGNL